MSSPQMQSFLTLLAMVAIASVTSCAIYFLLRSIENKSQLISVVISISILIFWAYRIVELGSNFAVFSSFLSVSIVVAIIGGLLHRKAGGSSKHLLYAILLMLSLSRLVGFINPYIASMLNLYGIRPFASLIPNASLTIWTVLSIQSLAPPILILLWKSSHLRPGMDKHFGEEDKATEKTNFRSNSNAIHFDVGLR